MVKPLCETRPDDVDCSHYHGKTKTKNRFIVAHKTLKFTPVCDFQSNLAYMFNSSTRTYSAKILLP